MQKHTKKKIQPQNFGKIRNKLNLDCIGSYRKKRLQTEFARFETDKKQNAESNVHAYVISFFVNDEITGMGFTHNTTD